MATILLAWTAGERKGKQMGGRKKNGEEANDRSRVAGKDHIFVM